MTGIRSCLEQATNLASLAVLYATKDIKNIHLHGIPCLVTVAVVKTNCY